MQERYTYGYNVGWNVENEYINELKGIMDEYNEQVKIIDEIQATHGRMLLSYEKELTEDEIREWYNQEYSSNNSLRSYEAYREDILAENEKRKTSVLRDIDRNREQYAANLYYLKDIKSDLHKVIYKRKNELELLLAERKLELSSINLEQHKKLNSPEYQPIGRNYDDVWLEIQKIEHALKELDKMSSLVEFTQEESNLMSRGLNPQQREIYDNIVSKKKKKDQPIPPIPKKEDPIIPGPTELEDDLDLELDLSEYEKALAEYEKELAKYQKELEKLYELQLKYENGQIEYSEYEAYAKYIVDAYNKILELYNNIMELKAKFEALISSKNEELINKLNQLKSEFEAEYQFRAHQQNGMEYNDPYLDGLQGRIQKIEQELERRKNLLKEPTKPQEPRFISERKIVDPQEEEPEENYDLKNLLYKIAGGYTYKKLDSFVYTHKDIKCFNWHHKNERTLLDKPLKLVKSGIATVITGASKLFSKAAYRKENVRERIDFCLENIKNLTEAEVEFLFKNLTATKMKELQNILPDLAWNALYNRFVKHIHSKVAIVNTQLRSLYISVAELYKIAMKIERRLANEGLTNEERMSFEAQLKQVSLQLCTNIKAYRDKFSEMDKELNASGLYGISENYRARRTTSVGGRNAKYYDSSSGRVSEGILGGELVNALNRKDGITAARYFIHQEQILIENTEEKRTLKNRFGKASTGVFQYSPLVEQADYSEDDYLRDVLQTIIIASSIVKMVHDIALQQQLDALQTQVQAQNAQIAQMNQDITTLKSMFASYNNDPQQFLESYYTTLKHSMGAFQGECEYLGMTAQAGTNTSMLTSSGSIYSQFDVRAHDFFGDSIRQMDTIFNNQALSVQEKIFKMGEVYKDGVNELASQAITHSANVNAHLGKYGSNFDFKALTTVLTESLKVDPSIVSTTFNEYVNAAIYVNNLQALSYINTLPADVDLVSSTIALAGIVGQDALNEYREHQKQNKDKVDVNEESKEEMKDAMLSVEIDEHELARERYEQAKEAWDSMSPFRRFINRKNKPELIDFEKEVQEEIHGRGL